MFLLHYGNYSPMGHFSYLNLLATFILLKVFRNPSLFLLLLVSWCLWGLTCHDILFLSAYTNSLKFWGSLLSSSYTPYWTHCCQIFQILYFLLCVPMAWAPISFFRSDLYCLVECTTYKSGLQVQLNCVSKLNLLFSSPKSPPNFLTFDNDICHSGSLDTHLISTVCLLYINQWLSAWGLQEWIRWMRLLNSWNLHSRLGTQKTNK